MKVKRQVDRCYHSCQFFNVTSQEMSCGHPYWKDKPTYDDMIITQDNSRGGKIPEKCPLRLEKLKIIYKLKEI